MSLVHQVLGKPGRDNALLVRVESGQRVSRLLFDCGDGCLSELSFAEIQAIDHLFFSHLHMDHVGGFDSFFRCTFNRQAKANRIWGPKGTSTILQHRLQGYWWNLVEGQNATWHINDVSNGKIDRFRYELPESFAVSHCDGAITTTDIILDEEDFTVRAIFLNHHGLCLGYLVQEKPKFNIQTDRLANLGLRPGAWVKHLKDGTMTGEVDINGKSFSMETLRAELLVESTGDSLAYLTDFLLDDSTFNQLVETLRGCRTVVCEAQYRDQDSGLAERNHHTTTKQVARMAAEADIGELQLFHLSDRYTCSEWNEMLAETLTEFERSSFPQSWSMKPGTDGR